MQILIGIVVIVTIGWWSCHGRVDVVVWASHRPRVDDVVANVVPI